jgi:hypothetical protein
VVWGANRKRQEAEITDELLTALEVRAMNSGLTLEAYLWAAMEAVEAYVVGVRSLKPYQSRDDKLCNLMIASNVARASIPIDVRAWIDALER